jgi:tetratricopeptide (TPR) repeat protein
LCLLGIIAVKTRRLELALEVLPQAVSANPRDAAAHTHLSAALLLLNRNDEALASADRALTLKPKDTLTLNIRACVLGNLNRHQESLDACDRALKIKPDYVEVMVNRGNALAQLNRPEDALASFDRARRLKPDFVQAINNCANVLKQLKRFDEALQRYDEALKLWPDFAEAAYNRGVTLSDLGRPREALKSYLRALEIQPDYLDARCNLAFCRLQLGDFSQGWKDYEAQWQKSILAKRQPVMPQPRWMGVESIRGKTILLHADEGLGDTIQFSRYAKNAKARGARVVLMVQRPLLKLLADINGADKVVAKGGRVPKTDYHCPLMKAAGAFNADLKTIPADIPYVHSVPVLVARWRKRLGNKNQSTKLRIGLAWSGNPAHTNDSNRSLALSDILALLKFDAEWVSLQKEVRSSDAAVLAQHPQIAHFGEQIKDFSDTAALVEHMDLVIAVDTSVAHLAGAMGKPVWILLPLNPDWRWLHKRDDSPWYPTARLFRQPVVGDWESVIVAVGKALKKHRIT